MFLHDIDIDAMKTVEHESDIKRIMRELDNNKNTKYEFLNTLSFFEYTNASLHFYANHINSNMIDKRHVGVTKWKVPQPPAFYFITREIFEKLVDFYWQDYVCLGYTGKWEVFRQWLEQFPMYHSFELE